LRRIAASESKNSNSLQVARERINSEQVLAHSREDKSSNLMGQRQSGQQSEQQIEDHPDEE